MPQSNLRRIVFAFISVSANPLIIERANRILLIAAHILFRLVMGAFYTLLLSKRYGRKHLFCGARKINFSF